MKEYDAIAIGSGSAMNILSAMMQRDPNIKVAVIDKDEPGGICLTRGCIPSRIFSSERKSPPDNFRNSVFVTFSH